MMYMTAQLYSRVKLNRKQTSTKKCLCKVRYLGRLCCSNCAKKTPPHIQEELYT